MSWKQCPASRLRVFACIPSCQGDSTSSPQVLSFMQIRRRRTSVLLVQSEIARRQHNLKHVSSYIRFESVEDIVLPGAAPAISECTIALSAWPVAHDNVLGEETVRSGINEGKSRTHSSEHSSTMHTSFLSK